MKTNTHTIRVIFWAMLGVAALLTSLALNQVSPAIQGTTLTPNPQVLTTTPNAEAQDGVGYTDGIMIVAVIIVLIVIIPILLKRREWENGKKNKTAPSS